MNDLLTVEDTLLEGMLELEAKCQSTHTALDNPTCSTLATHRSTPKCKGRTILLCALAANAVMARIKPGATCPNCHNRVGDCWQVLPA